MLIVFEGLDNSGKTTICEQLEKELTDRKCIVDYTREFETNIGKEIKRMSEAGELDSYSKAFLFACDRHIRLKKYKGSDFENKIILFDRYFQSAVAYRMAEGIDGEWVKSINSIFPPADLVFYIDITPEESINRMTEGKFNIPYSLEELCRVRNAYSSIISYYNMIIIDGMRPFNDVYNDVYSIVINKLAEEKND